MTPSGFSESVTKNLIIFRRVPLTQSASVTGYFQKGKEPLRSAVICKGSMTRCACDFVWTSGDGLPVDQAPSLPSTLAIAVMVFQLRVVTGTPKSRSIVPR